MKIRSPAVAGSFYPAGREHLEKLLSSFMAYHPDPLPPAEKVAKLIGGIVPHAGYGYSGRIAVPFFQAVATSGETFDTVIILHPNHTSIGPTVALDMHEGWQTPLGVVAVDVALGDRLGFERSAEAHRYEHSAEVIVPMLQHFLPGGFMILPVAMGRIGHHEARKMAEKLREAVSAEGRKALIIASSDFSHFVTPEAGKELDDRAIEHIIRLDTEGFYDTVLRYRISICGYGPIMSLMEYVRPEKEHIAVQILARGHSGEVTLDDEVVHYLCAGVYRAEGTEGKE